MAIVFLFFEIIGITFFQIEHYRLVSAICMSKERRVPMCISSFSLKKFFLITISDIKMSEITRYNDS